MSDEDKHAWRAPRLTLPMSASKKREVARRKLALRQAFLDRHKLRLTFREKVGVVLGLIFAATGGPLYPWLPDELRFQPYRRKHKHRDRA